MNAWSFKTRLEARGGREGCECESCRSIQADLEADIAAEAFRDRRARVNDEQALDDMFGRGTPDDVPRATHLPVRASRPHSGETLLLVGMLIGCMAGAGFLIATWPAVEAAARCTP